MQLKADCNLENFLRKVRECHSRVTFETTEGDVLIMQSALCQVIFISLQYQPELLSGGQILCEDERDYVVLKDFLNS